MSRAAAFTTLAMAVLIAGCTDPKAPLSPPGDDAGSDASVWDPIRELLANVPCEVEAGADDGSNLKRISNVTFEGGTHAEADAAGPWMIVARYGDGGFELVNITDPLHPVIASTFTDAPGALDVKFSPDNQTVLVGHGAGIILVDVRNPDEPVKVGEWTFPLIYAGVLAFQNAHMLATARIAESDWVFVAAETGNGVWILKLEGPPEARTLTHVANTLPVEGGPLGPHDMFVAFDSALDAWLLYVADGFTGWTVFDVNDPAAPQRLGGWVRPETGYTHTVQPAWVGDRRLVAAIQEVGVNKLTIWDASDFTQPVPLAVWQADPGAGSGDPQHNLNVVGDMLYVAHYGHGFYVFDLSQVRGGTVLDNVDFGPIAHYPSDGLGTPIGFGGFWDVVVQDGLVYASHTRDGLQVVGFGCNTPGDPLLTSTG